MTFALLPPIARRRFDDRASTTLPHPDGVVGHTFALVGRAAILCGHDVVEQLLRSGHLRLRERTVRHSATLSLVSGSTAMAEGAALSRRGPGSAVLA